jgi:thiol-disulfide isomerase/thioredoxin
MRRALAISALSAVAAAAIVAFTVWREAEPTFPPEPNTLAARAEPTLLDKLPFTLLDAPRPLPQLNFVNGDGEPMTLSDLHDRIVLLNVWATWCVPCRKEMPALDRLQAKLGGPAFVVVPLSIDRQGLEVVERFYRALGLKSLGIYLDKSSNAAHAINSLGVPTTLLIDREGRELGRKLGVAEWDGTEMVSRIKGYLGTRDRDTRADAASAGDKGFDHEPAR